MRQMEGELWRRLQRRPTTSELAAALGWRPSTVWHMQTLAADTVGDELLQDRAATPEDALLEAELCERVDRAVQRLPRAQRTCIRLRFGLDGGEGCTVATIAVHRGTSRSSANVSLRAASTALRRSLRAWR
jgi:RNA polymerase primary sigma factor/RNA polymerase nonessential primary-like sigma factor